MQLYQIKNMVRQNKSKRGLKYSPSYRYGKHWASSGEEIALLKFSLCPSPLEKHFKIGGKVII